MGILAGLFVVMLILGQFPAWPCSTADWPMWTVEFNCRMSMLILPWNGLLKIL
jgi:hypothetical protein